MVTIRIDNTGDGLWWLYNANGAWKDYVTDNFDEKVILFGNRDYGETTNASWYENAKTILNDIDFYDECPENLDDDTNAKLKELYDNCSCTEEIFMDVLKLLYPNDTFSKGTIRGYMQGEWQDYIIKGNDIDVDMLENLYFGKLSDITVIKEYEDETQNEEYGDVIVDDELWQAERDGLLEYFRKRYEIPDNEELHIYESDGYIREIKWKEVV